MSPRDEARFELLCDHLVAGDTSTMDELCSLAAGDPALELELELLENRDEDLSRPLEGADAALLERTLGRVLSQGRAPVRSHRRPMKVMLIAAAVVVLSGLVAAQVLRESGAPAEVGTADASEGAIEDPSPAGPSARAPALDAGESSVVDGELDEAEIGVEVEAEGDPAEVDVVVDAPPARVLSALELFERAGHARGEGRAADAARLYRRLQARYPGSQEALASRLSLARLLSSSLREPRAALAQLDAYLARAGDGVLAPECRYQRILVLRTLGRRDAEERALVESLARDPGSVYAGPVGRRLEELRDTSEGD